MKRFLLALALTLLAAPAWAQCNGVFQPQTICGNSGVTPNTPKQVPMSAFPATAGGTNGQVQYNNAGALGGFTTGGDATINTSSGVLTISPLAVNTTKIAAGAVTNAKLAVGASNTVKGSVDGILTSDLAVTSCSAIYQFTQWIAGTGWSCGLSPVLPSRAVAAVLDLSAFGAIKTLGYADPGDGGGAIFRNRTTTPFRDSFVTAVSITGNGTSGCTNGTYRNVKPTGGTGTNLILRLTVSGNVVTAAAIDETGGNGYTAADALSTTVTGCSTGVTLSVTTVSTPTCSFSDTASNHIQIVYDGSAPYVNPKQCGAKFDYAGTDGTATNDFAAIQNAISYASDIHSPTIDGGGSAGGKVVLPPGNALICGGVPINQPQGVGVEGVGMWASTIKICAAWGSSANFWNICDPDTQASCFASYLRNFTIYAPFNLDGSSGVSAIYSNSIQQVNVIDRVAVYAGRRRCLTFETGYGGAALLGIDNFECTPGDTTTINVGMLINYGTTLVTMRNVHVETSGPNNIFGLAITGGFVSLEGFHSEGITTPIFVNIPTNNSFGMVMLQNLSGGVSCTDMVFKQGGSAASSLGVAQIVANGCTRTMNNGGAGTTTNILQWTYF